MHFLVEIALDGAMPRQVAEKRRKEAHSWFLRSGFDCPADRRDDTLPIGELRIDLASTCGRQLVVLRASTILRLAPLRGQPPSLFEAMQSGEQGSRFDVERAASDLLDATCDAYAVVWLEQEGTQDQKVERPL